MVAVGVDIGGSKVAAAALTGPARSWREHGLRPDTATTAGVVAAIRAAALAVAGGDPVDAVGLSVAGWLSADRRRVVHAANLGLRDVPLPDLVAAALDCPVVMENDGNAAAVAEAVRAAADAVAAGRTGAGTVVVLALGTGVGGGVVLPGGTVLTGDGGLAGELGHLPVPGDGRPCVCGGLDCLELYASGPGLAAAAGTPDARAAVAAAGRGDPRAAAALRAAAAALAAAVRILQPVLDPARVVLAGSVAEGAGPPLRDAVTAALAGPGPLAAVAAPPEISLSTLGPYACAIGAAELAAGRKRRGLLRA
ncbi:MAG TPA: ROK family protein [Mycobacteriales bacterium]|nr:ROK family protein [Mycobacteriales bacterium]